ncbi:hypothetical protein SESBI_01835 [Sesbania bispinosa]|nr:hypothetical protein SESBI_01835 [Sesbania bispinosa]
MACWFPSQSQPGIQEEDRVCSLINKMMVNNSVNITGEGILGRAAFTGNHQWVLLNNFARDAYPPEVCTEVINQFSAGMQTVAVIPVLPHGVVQLGSFLPISRLSVILWSIMENMGFVNDVKSLILQLGCIPGALLSEDYSTKLSNGRLAGPVTDCVPVSVDPPVITSSCTPNVVNGSNQLSNSSHAPRPIAQQPHLLQGEINNYQGSVLTPQNHALNQIFDSLCQPKAHSMIKTSVSSGQQENTFLKAEAQVIPANLDSCLQQHPVSYNASSAFTELAGSGQSSSNDCNLKYMEQQILSGVGRRISNSPELSTADFSGTQKVGFGIQNDNSNKAGIYSVPNLTSQSATNHMHLEGSNQKNLPLDLKHVHDALASTDQRIDDDLLQALKITSLQLEDHVPMSDQINGFLRDCLNKDVSNQHMMQMNVKHEEACAQLPSGDDLFDVLGVDFKRKLLNGNWNKLLVNEYGNAENQDKKVTCMNMPGIGPDNSYSVSEAISDSGIFSGTGTDHLLDAVVSRAQSAAKMNSDEMSCRTTLTRSSTTSVPSPACKQCSIDALLERTIKHMLFLQSVTKHADKLKQTGESKIVSKEGGLLLKDNFEGGATWAYEVGSQSMVCPIIVEDLNHPRQMLVEMLCEERGFFLEIADLIRGLGLTILKGVMESRNDKIWARFAVEANRDVTRMEIFMSLVRLLEQTVKGGAASSSNAMDNNMMAYHSFPQATQIPATGRPSSLQ